MTKRMAFIPLLLWAATISAPAQLTTLASFNKTNGRDPGWPASPFVQGADGNFYGTTAAGGASDEGTVFAMSPFWRAHRGLAPSASTTDLPASLLKSFDGTSLQQLILLLRFLAPITTGRGILQAI